MRRKTRCAVHTLYQLYNRGNRGQILFPNEEDYVRFLFLILYLQAPTPVTNIGYRIKQYMKQGTFSIYKVLTENIAINRSVQLINFALMPNHFHLTILQERENGITKYMQRVLNAYTKYFNIKYKKEGHLFQGPFRVIPVTDNEQLLYLSAYIHRNPRELREWRNKEETYPYSSFQDYTENNRWKLLLSPAIIVNRFNHPQDYKDFVRATTTPILKEKLDETHCIED